MNDLYKDFSNRPEDEKLVMGYLASGYSAYDLLSKHIELMQLSKDKWDETVKEVKAAVKEANEVGDCVFLRKYFLDCYEELGETINTTIV